MILTIKFCYHRGSLAESLRTIRVFSSWEQLFGFLECNSKIDGVPMFKVSDIVVGNTAHHDRRIGWKDTRIIAVKRFGDQIHDPPAAIGHVATEFCEPTDLSWS